MEIFMNGTTSFRCITLALATAACLTLAGFAHADPTAVPAGASVPHGAVPLDPNYPGLKTGLGQATPREPAQLGNLKLTDPLVRQKYLNEPDLLKFLRATYSDVCARGLINMATKQVKMDPKGQWGDREHKAAGQLMESNRIWKMTSYEMEAIFGQGYLRAANFCDCIMKDVSDSDLVDPTKGLNAVEKVTTTSQAACESYAKEETAAEIAAHPESPANRQP
jgi:hypothetical protein